MQVARSEAHSNTDMSPLRQRLWALPTELYDMILQDALILQIPAVTAVTEDYQPPIQLHLCHELRSVVAETYYAKAKFQFDDVNLLLRWVASLPETHRRLLQCVRLNMHPTAFVEPIPAYQGLEVDIFMVHSMLNTKLPHQRDWNCVFLNVMKRVDVNKWAAIWISVGDHPRTRWRVLTGHEY